MAKRKSRRCPSGQLWAIDSRRCLRNLSYSRCHVGPIPVADDTIHPVGHEETRRDASFTVDAICLPLPQTTWELFPRRTHQETQTINATCDRWRGIVQSPPDTDQSIDSVHVYRRLSVVSSTGIVIFASPRAYSNTNGTSTKKDHRQRTEAGCANWTRGCIGLWSSSTSTHRHDDVYRNSTRDVSARPPPASRRQPRYLCPSSSPISECLSRIKSPCGGRTSRERYGQDRGGRAKWVEIGWEKDATRSEGRCASGRPWSDRDRFSWRKCPSVISGNGGEGGEIVYSTAKYGGGTTDTGYITSSIVTPNRSGLGILAGGHAHATG